MPSSAKPKPAGVHTSGAVASLSNPAANPSGRGKVTPKISWLRIESLTGKIAPSERLMTGTSCATRSRSVTMPWIRSGLMRKSPLRRS